MITPQIILTDQYVLRAHENLTGDHFVINSHSSVCYVSVELFRKLAATPLEEARDYLHARTRAKDFVDLAWFNSSWRAPEIEQDPEATFKSAEEPKPQQVLTVLDKLLDACHETVKEPESTCNGVVYIEVEQLIPQAQDLHDLLLRYKRKVELLRLPEDGEHIYQVAIGSICSGVLTVLTGGDEEKLPEWGKKVRDIYNGWLAS